MPALDNIRHEAFCQYLSEGKTQTESYALAYDRDIDETAQANGSRLLLNAKVKSRIEELQKRHAKQNDITAAAMTRKLLDIHQRALEKDDLTNARQAVMDASKLNGLIIDKSQVESDNVNWIISDSPMTEEEWEAQCVDQDTLEASAGATTLAH